MSGCPAVAMISTCSMPMRFRSAATKSAARRTSFLCSGSVLTLGIRRRSLSSLRKRCLFSRAKSRAAADMGAPKESGQLVSIAGASGRWTVDGSRGEAIGIEGCEVERRCGAGDQFDEDARGDGREQDAVAEVAGGGEVSRESGGAEDREVVGGAGA